MTDIVSQRLVSFIIPCYRLGHLLRECVDSILMQTYGEFEILLMDDCSPDNTPQIAGSLTDKRVTYIRNKINLGHLRNYNKGIDLAKGEYIWLISADDRLRSPKILERYVGFMEKHPEVGYMFCPGHGVDGVEDQGLLDWSAYGSNDAVLKGWQFLMDLLERNFILAPAAMVRRECYDRICKFPEDMPYGGDWFLWCMFALYYDVGYCAEPMVDYRIHELSMSTTLSNENIRACIEDDIVLRWRIKRQAELLGASVVVERCTNAIIKEYAGSLTSKAVRGARTRISAADFERSLSHFEEDATNVTNIRTAVYKLAGDYLYWQGNYAESVSMYRHAVSARVLQPTVWTKLGLLSMGTFGVNLRDAAGWLKRTVLTGI